MKQKSCYKINVVPIGYIYIFHTYNKLYIISVIGRLPKCNIYLKDTFVCGY